MLQQLLEDIVAEELEAGVGEHGHQCRNEASVEGEHPLLDKHGAYSMTKVPVNLFNVKTLFHVILEDCVCCVCVLPWVLPEQRSVCGVCRAVGKLQ